MPRRARTPAASRRRCCSTPAPSLTIVGHSERRDAQRESDDEVKAKADGGAVGGLDVILCVGESLEVREQGGAVETVLAQLDASLPDSIDARRELAIAYEPIWAIGTGKVPTSRGNRAKCTPPSAPGSSERYGAAGSAGPDPLRRLGQGRRMRQKSSRSPTSTARWSAAPASRLPISCRSSPPPPPVEG